MGSNSVQNFGILNALCVIVILSVQGAVSAINDRMLLSDLNVLTLYHGRYTAARRTSPIPQMKCVGGTAGCSSFTPQTVQCYNRGSDGFDAQWECKTDMDNAYRFGQVEVSCEGYDYPNDPYIYRGSCGLEYTLDLTKEGHQQQHHGQHSYYGNGAQHEGSRSSSSYADHYRKKSGGIFGDVVTLAVVAVIIYAIYRTCIANVGTEADENVPQDDYRGNRGYRSGPPPPGFRDDYMPDAGCSSSNYQSSSSSRNRGTGAMGGGGLGGTGLGGFWTGAATGGLLGYMMGNRNTGNTYARPGYGSGWGSGWGNSWGSGSGFGSRGFGGSSGWTSGGGSGWSSGGGSTGTRTASGFGGTKRR